MKKNRAWHFCAKNKAGVPVLGYDAKRLEVATGYVYSIEPGCRPKLCVYGMHASRRVLDALLYAPGTVACLVDVWGDVVESNDKLVGRHREVIAMVHAEMILHRFACWCVRQVWDQLTDERSRRAVEVKEAWVEGRATDDELWEAWGAALAASNTTAARAAARAAAACDTAWSEASDVACYSARLVAESMAWGAGDGPEVGLSTHKLERSTQNAQLERMLLEAMGRGSMND